MNLKKLKARYARMDDRKLEKIALSGADAVQPQVRPIIAAEIRKRGLDASLLIGFEDQQETIPREALQQLTDKIRGLPCPGCGAHDDALVGGLVRKVRSYVVVTYHETNPMIACPACLRAERRRQLVWNSLLGWWGFPSGLLLHTPEAIYGHFADKSKSKEISEQVLQDFALAYLEELQINWDREPALVEILRHRNGVNIPWKCPILIEDKQWVERHLDWIQEHILDVVSQPTILPNDPAFNWNFKGSEEDAYIVLRTVSEYMQLDTRRIRLEFFDEESPYLDPRIAEYLATGQRAAGFYEHDGENHYILIEVKQLRDPAALIGTMVHELCHYVLIGEHQVYLEGEANEWLTDLLAVAYGFGVFIGNLKFTYSSWQSASEGASFWQISSTGYLPQQITAYAMAMIETQRNNSLPDWVKFLRGDFRGDFKKSMEYLLNNKR